MYTRITSSQKTQKNIQHNLMYSLYTCICLVLMKRMKTELICSAQLDRMKNDFSMTFEAMTV